MRVPSLAQPEALIGAATTPVVLALLRTCPSGVTGFFGAWRANDKEKP
jgi:hypothetical protein